MSLPLPVKLTQELTPKILCIERRPELASFNIIQEVVSYQRDDIKLRNKERRKIYHFF